MIAMLQAKREWEAAALDFMIRTLEAVKAMRPKATWGYYGFPDGHQLAVWQEPYLNTSDLRLADTHGVGSITHLHDCDNSKGKGFQCAYDDPIAGQRMRDNNDRLQPLFAAQTGFFPCIYICPNGCEGSQGPLGPPGHSSPRTPAVFRSTIGETMRVKAAAKSDAPVLAYAWERYMEGALGGMLEQADLEASVYIPSQMGADGLVWWGGPNCINSSEFW